MAGDNISKKTYYHNNYGIKGFLEALTCNVVMLRE